MAYKGIEIIIIVYKRHLFTKSLKKSVSKFTYSSVSLTSLVSLSTLKTIRWNTVLFAGIQYYSLEYSIM